MASGRIDIDVPPGSPSGTPSMGRSHEAMPRGAGQRFVDARPDSLWRQVAAALGQPRRRPWRLRDESARRGPSLRDASPRRSVSPVARRRPGDGCGPHVRASCTAPVNARDCRVVAISPPTGRVSSRPSRTQRHPARSRRSGAVAPAMATGVAPGFRCREAEAHALPEHGTRRGVAQRWRTCFGSRWGLCGPRVGLPERGGASGIGTDY